VASRNKTKNNQVTQLTQVTGQKQAKRFLVSGRVQGVGYRYFAHTAAAQLGVTGYVKNLPDGRVEAYAIGTEPQLEAFVTELRRGPRHSAVHRIDEADANVMDTFTSRFSIDYES